MKKEIDHMSDLSIDKFNLDLEWEKQAHLYMAATELHSLATEIRDSTKLDIDIEKASFNNEVRLNWKKHFDTKPTESAITNLVTASEKLVKLQRRLIVDNKNVNILQGKLNALSHKKAALESESRLYISGYYSDPNIPVEARDHAAEGGKKKHAKKIEESMKKRKGKQ